MDKETVERGWCIAFESRHDVELERFAFRDGREDVSPGYLYPVVGSRYIILMVWEEDDWAALP